MLAQGGELEVGLEASYCSTSILPSFSVQLATPRPRRFRPWNTVPCKVDDTSLQAIWDPAEPFHLLPLSTSSFMRATIAIAAGLLSFTYASTLTPPVLPLVVRNPYLSIWLSNARHEPWSTWPIFWHGQSVRIILALQHLRMAC